MEFFRIQRGHGPFIKSSFCTFITIDLPTMTWRFWKAQEKEKVKRVGGCCLWIDLESKGERLGGVERCRPIRPYVCCTVCDSTPCTGMRLWSTVSYSALQYSTEQEQLIITEQCTVVVIVVVIVVVMVIVVGAQRVVVVAVWYDITHSSNRNPARTVSYPSLPDMRCMILS